MPKLAFRPDADGFLFSNQFVWDAVERIAISALSTQITPAVIAVFAPIVALNPPLATAVTAAVATYLALPSTPLPNDNGYGLCGGMCYAALDYWHTRMIPPRGATPDDQPARGTSGEPVRVMIWDRLIDSLRTGDVLRRTIEWMVRLHTVPGFLGGGAGWLNDRTAEEWQGVKNHIDQGHPWPIALVGDTTQAWNQHQILAYGYEDSGTTKTLYVYDPNDPHDYGNTADTEYSFSFSSNGLNVTKQYATGIGTLKGFFCSGYTPMTPLSGLAPVFGQFVGVNESPRVWMMADGERFPVANPPELTALGGSFAGVRMRPVFTSNSSRPRDGAILKELSQPEVFIIQGGARFHIPSPEVLEQFGGFGVVHVVPDGTLQQFQRGPRDGTLLRELSDPMVFLIDKKQRRWVTMPSHLAPLGGFPSVRLVPDGALASIPIGKPVGSAEELLRNGSFTTGDGDEIQYEVVSKAASNDIVEFQLCQKQGLTWEKRLNLPDGEGSSWDLIVKDNQRCDTNSLWAQQVLNGQLLTFAKAKFLGQIQQVHTLPLASLGGLPGGSRVTFTWMKD